MCFFFFSPYRSPMAQHHLLKRLLIPLCTLPAPPPHPPRPAPISSTAVRIFFKCVRMMSCPHQNAPMASPHSIVGYSSRAFSATTILRSNIITGLAPYFMRRLPRERFPQPTFKTVHSSPERCGSVGWASPTYRKVASYIRSQGTCLGCPPGPRLWGLLTQGARWARWGRPLIQCLFRTSIFLSLFLPPFPSP